MTQDLVDDFSEALDREKRGYLICVHTGLDKPLSGCHVRTELKHWPEPAKAENRSKAHDMLLAIAAALSEEGGERFEIVRNKRRDSTIDQTIVKDLKSAYERHARVSFLTGFACGFALCNLLYVLFS